MTVGAAGFEPIGAEEDLVEGTVAEVDYRLATKAEGLEVTVRGERPPREVTRRTIEQREMSRIPGTNGDALRSLQNLPGVGRPPGLAGLLIIRGSAPMDTAVFIDGVFVPLVYHFGGLSSVVPTEMLEKIDFFPGNFSAQYGRVMGGIVDVGIRSPNPDGKYHGLAQFDLIDGRVLLEGPVPLLKGWSFLAGARRSWVDTWLKPVLTEAGAGVTSAPVYYDYQAYVETHPTSRSAFRLGVYGSDDSLEILIRDPFEQDPAFGGNLALRTGFYRIEARYTNDITDRLKFATTASYGRDRFDFGVGTFFFRIRNNALINRTELSYRLFSGVTLHGGIDIGFAPYSFEIRAPPPPRPGEPDPGPFASRPPITQTGADNFWRPAAYLEAEVNPDERSKIVPSRGATTSSTTFREPRSKRARASTTNRPSPKKPIGSSGRQASRPTARSITRSALSKRSRVPSRFPSRASTRSSIAWSLACLRRARRRTSTATTARVTWSAERFSSSTSPMRVSSAGSRTPSRDRRASTLPITRRACSNTIRPTS